MFTGGEFEAIAFYTNHINITICEKDRPVYSIDNENPRIGKSACGKSWITRSFSNPTEPIEIIVHNPHDYGNENAIDQMLSKIEIVSRFTPANFEKGVLDSGRAQRNIGLAIIIASVMFLGTALFSSLIH